MFRKVDHRLRELIPTALGDMEVGKVTRVNPLE